MKSRRMVGLLAIAIAGTIAVPAQAAPTRPPFLPMALITVSRGENVALQDVFVTFPAEWSCSYGQFDPFAIDITCIPPAAPAGFTNWCGWVAAASVSTTNNEFAPQTTSYCGNAAATAGRGAVGAVATANTQLNALRCRVNITADPPNVSFTASCTTNH